jgi:hypothetical protein
VLSDIRMYVRQIGRSLSKTRLGVRRASAMAETFKLRNSSSIGALLSGR